VVPVEEQSATAHEATQLAIDAPKLLGREPMKSGGADGCVHSANREPPGPSGLSKVGDDPGKSTPNRADRLLSDSHQNRIDVYGEGGRLREAAKESKAQGARAGTEIDDRESTPAPGLQGVEHRLKSVLPRREVMFLLPIPSSEPRLPVGLSDVSHSGPPVGSYALSFAGNGSDLIRLPPRWMCGPNDSRPVGHSRLTLDSARSIGPGPSRGSRAPVSRGAPNYAAPITGGMAGIVEGVGHIIIPVEEMGTALGFYRNLLGFQVRGKVNPVWTELDAGGFPLTLYRSGESSRIAIGPTLQDTPLVFHVANYPEAEAALGRAKVRFQREGEHQGVIWDPFGNVLRLHDHRER
jgi:hypothetical protein